MILRSSGRIATPDSDLAPGRIPRPSRVLPAIVSMGGGV